MKEGRRRRTASHNRSQVAKHSSGQLTAFAPFLAPSSPKKNRRSPPCAAGDSTVHLPSSPSSMASAKTAASATRWTARVQRASMSVAGWS